MAQAARALLRKHELYLESDLPIRPVIRLDHIVIGTKLCVHWERSEVEYLAEGGTDRDRPALAIFGLPVDGDNRRAADIETTREVVVEERLDQAVVVGAATLAARQRPDIVGQHPVHPRVPLFHFQAARQ